ncbi:MAG: universal stress protein [Bacteroidota bacterium]
MAKIRIIVPTDFSEIANNALKLAIDLAKKIDGELILVNAFNIPTSYGEVGVNNLVKGMAYEVEKDIEQKFIELEDNVEGLSEILFKTEVKHGTVSNVINSLVGLYNADLIVMGTKGASGLEEVIIGSNASDALKYSKCPVLVVPQNSSIEGLHKVVFASDFKRIDNKESLAPLKLIMLLYKSDLAILHINTSESDLSEEELEEKKALETYFKGSPQVNHELTYSSVESGIKEYISKNPTDLLAMVRRKHGFWEKLLKGSQTQKLVDHGDVPVLIFPAENG